MRCLVGCAGSRRTSLTPRDATRPTPIATTRGACNPNATVCNPNATSALVPCAATCLQRCGRIQEMATYAATGRPDSVVAPKPRYDHLIVGANAAPTTGRVAPIKGAHYESPRPSSVRLATWRLGAPPRTSKSHSMPRMAPPHPRGAKYMSAREVSHLQTRNLPVSYPNNAQDVFRALVTLPDTAAKPLARLTGPQHYLNRGWGSARRHCGSPSNRYADAGKEYTQHAH
jgi:hypothetical protein